ncbi:MAG: peptidylprolyl isomerase, partial [Saprospiraceae bacterium]|nr:peptidylprolyl isomerase [Saprospiraceae bacterium]
MMARFKQISFVLIFISISFLASAQKSEDILMTVGNIPVSVGEFKYIYEKNNGKEANYSKASIDEYLDLYTKFKLKVNEARTTKLDTISSLQEELEGYKRQLASSYIMDKGVNDYLLNELKERIKKDVKFSHIFVAIPNGADDSIVAAKKKTIDEAYERLQAGAPFENMVRFFSEDKLTSEAGGDMGFFTAMMPNGFYEFESMLYNNPIGKYSKPVRSRIGWHIIKVTEERTARGEVEVAHILIRKSTDPAGDKTKIENIYSQLQNGGNWENLAATLSEDEQSSRGGGLLPVFGINTYERNFEDAAFALQSPGSYSKPLETRAGWHILKLVRNHDPLDDDNFKKYYEQRIKNDDRYGKTKTSLLSNIRQASNFKEDLALLQKFGAGLDDEFYTFKWEPKSSNLMGNTLMAFDDNNKYTLSDFATYAQKNTRIRLRYDKTVNSIEEPVNALYDAFKEEKTIAFEQGNLEKKYPDFKSLMREYEEGILLFEVTKNAVWDRANQDTVGLANYFSKNRNKYMNEER